MKICIKMWMKTCFHSHFYANYQLVLWKAIKATNMLQLYTTNFLYPWLWMDLDFIQFSKLWWFKCFYSQFQQAPGPVFRNVGKSLHCHFHMFSDSCFNSCFCCRLQMFFKIVFPPNSFRNTIRVSNGLDPESRSGSVFCRSWSGSIWHSDSVP